MKNEQEAEAIESRLAAAVEAQLAGCPCQTAVLARWLPAGDAPAHTLYSHRAAEQVVSASTIKVPVLLAALSLCDKKQLSLAEEIPLAEADILPDTAVFEPENRRPAYPLWELLYWMITESDNTATNRLLALLGFAEINTFCQSLGLQSTRVERKMLDWEGIRQGKNNYTSAEDQYRLYAALLGPGLLQPETQNVAVDILCHQRSMNGILRYLPTPMPFAHKTGCLDYLEHDAGVFLGARRLFLGVFTWHGPSPEGD
ncbi:MAG: class A beta-lactamase-related serine hydrolase, partial [Gemmiger sp.]|nr:class A beta-lactamase-related serine hydrolase [Gemmiger sp.]